MQKCEIDVWTHAGTHTDELLLVWVHAYMYVCEVM